MSEPNTLSFQSLALDAALTVEGTHTVRPTGTTPLQLAVLRALDEHLGVAPESTLLTFLEATSVWTRASGRYAVAELLAMGLLWREGDLLGLTSEACSLVA